MKWAGRGFWAVIDQALFAGTNFLLNLFLARWSDPATYGAFSTAYAFFLLLGTIHTSLWTEPALVYGSGRFRDALSTYERVLGRLHWRFSFVVSLGLLFLSLLLAWTDYFRLESALRGLALAVPFVLYLWLIRRMAYVVLNPVISAMAGFLYLLLSVGVILSLARAGWLDAFSSFLVMGIAALFSALTVRFLLFGKSRRLNSPVSQEEVFSLHWSYGRWALLANLLSWVPGNFFLAAFPFLGGERGLVESAWLRAAYNLLMPVLHLNAALSSLLLPLLVREKTHPERVKGVLVKAMGLQLVIAFGFMLFLFLWGETLARAFYGEFYSFRGLEWFALVGVAEAITNVIWALMRSQEQVGLLLQVQIGMAAVTFAATIFPLHWGAGGAALGIVLAKGVGAILSWTLVKRRGLWPI